MDHGASSYRRYLDGNEEAFDEILKEYWAPLVSFLGRMVGVTAAAEDIAMDVFADLIADRKKYNFKVSLKTYLYMLGRSRALNYIKRNRIVPTVPLEDVFSLPSLEPGPEAKLLSRERSQAVGNAMSELKPDLRDALVLTYWEGLSCEDAAKVMKKSRKQVYNLLYRAKAQLRAALESEGIYEF